MALKYWFEFTDVKKIVHRCEIYNDDFLGLEQQIFGTCYLSYASTEDILEPIRGSGLTINLEANNDLTFSDLYSEEERTFSVIYKRDNVTLFNGWLSSDGLYEDLVSNKWIISLECIDGLGFLSNLSYVEDSTGFNFTGKQSLLEIVVNCLKRTSINQNILINCDIFYDGLDETLSTFENVYYNSDRFIKDDKDTIMNCDEVLRSVLEPFGCVITTYEGKWLIYKPNSLASDNNLPFFYYNYNGLSLPNQILNLSLNVGSDIDKFYPFHAQGNQQKSIKSAIGAYRINYKYGFAKNISNNPTFLNDGTDIEEWTINSNTNLYLTQPNILEFTPIETAAILQITSGTNAIQTGQSLTFLLSSEMTEEIILDTPPEQPRYDIEIEYKIKITGTTNYFLNAKTIAGERIIEWSTIDDNLQTIVYGGGYDLNESKSYELLLPPIPEDGSIFIEIHSVKINPETTVLDYGKIRIISTSLQVNETNEDAGIQGENHTFQRILKPSSKIQPKKEVFNGDLKSDIFNGAIYKSNKVDLTEKWKRKNVTESKPILQIMGEERMKMYSSPLQVFKGTFFGYFNYLTLLSINNINGNFISIEYDYDCANNLVTIKALEAKNTNILNDIEYKITYDYGNVVEPTIK